MSCWRMISRQCATPVSISSGWTVRIVVLTDMALDDKLVVLECALAQVSVMFVVVIVRLAKKVLRGKHVITSGIGMMTYQAVKVMKAFDVDRISATMLFADLDEVLGHAYVASLLRRDADRPNCQVSMIREKTTRRTNSQPRWMPMQRRSLHRHPVGKHSP